MLSRLFFIIIGLLFIKSSYGQQINSVEMIHIETKDDLIVYYPNILI